MQIDLARIGMRPMPRKRRRSPAPETVPNAVPATPEYAQHHDVDTRQRAVVGNEGWRVRTRLDGLLAAGKIGAAEWQAGATYRTAVEHGEMGGRIGGPGGGDGCPMTARLLALKRLGEARAVLTPMQRAAMDGVAADVSWPAMGAQIGCGRDAAEMRAREALTLLADHYGLRGKAGRIRTLVA